MDCTFCDVEIQGNFCHFCGQQYGHFWEVSTNNFSSFDLNAVEIKKSHQKTRIYYSQQIDRVITLIFINTITKDWFRYTHNQNNQTHTFLVGSYQQKQNKNDSVTIKIQPLNYFSGTSKTIFDFKDIFVWGKKACLPDNLQKQSLQNSASEIDLYTAPLLTALITKKADSIIKSQENLITFD